MFITRDQKSSSHSRTGGRVPGVRRRYCWVVDQLRLTVEFEPVEEGWVQARIAEFPAVITAGATRAEARELVIDALAEYLAAISEASTPGPDAEDLTLVVRESA